MGPRQATDQTLTALTDHMTADHPLRSAMQQRVMSDRGWTYVHRVSVFGNDRSLTMMDESDHEVRRADESTYTNETPFEDVLEMMGVPDGATVHSMEFTATGLQVEYEVCDDAE